MNYVCMYVCTYIRGYFIVYCCCVFGPSHVWSQMAADWESNCKKKWKQIRELAWRGVPNPMRTLVWPLLAGVGTSEATLKIRYPQLLAVSMGTVSFGVMQVTQCLDCCLLASQWHQSDSRLP